MSYINEHFTPLMELSIKDENKTPRKYVKAFAKSMIEKDWNVKGTELEDLIGFCLTDLGNEIYNDMLDRDTVYFENEEASKHLYFKDGTVFNEEAFS